MTAEQIALCFLLSFLVSKLTQQNLCTILEYYLRNISPSTRIYQQSAARAFTIFGMYGLFAATLILIVQNYLQLVSCLVISIIAIHFCMVSRTLTSPNFNIVFRIDGPLPCDKVTSIYSQCSTGCFVHFIGCKLKFRILLNISSLTYKHVS